MNRLWVALAAVACVSGCAGQSDPRDDRQVHQRQSNRYGVQDWRVACACDPVTGREVRTDTPYTATYRGHTYYFESSDSQARFQATPETYIASSGQ